jgi:hypothetical protein
MTKQEVWGTSINASYGIGEKTRLEAGGSQYLRFAKDLTDSKSWQGRVGVKYLYSEAMTYSINATNGYSSIDPGPDYTTRTITADLNWKPGSRLSLGVSGGGEFIRFKIAGAQTRSRPTYSGSISYQVFEPTSIAVNIGQSSGAAYFSSQYTESFRVGFRLSQRILGKLSLVVFASEADVDYVQTTNLAGTAARSDTLRSYHATLRMPVTDNLTASLSWQRNNSKSNTPIFDVDNSIVGAEISWRY